MPHKDPIVVEWPTLLLLIATYAVWAIGTTFGYLLHPVLGIVITGVAITQFASLQHEALHGHPFRNGWLNEALVFPALNLTVPYRRFRDDHLAHHHDPALTDPYDDPESNYMDPAVWHRLSRGARAVLRLNNTLLGRIVIGPLVGNSLWLWSEAGHIWRAERAARNAWTLHLGGLALVALWLWMAAMPFWAYLLAMWVGHSVLKIRTFAEHRAHDLSRARTVLVEDRGPLALLFLNNNLHVVHHMHPGVPWYRLPALYAEHRDHYQRRNEGYVFTSYRQVFAQYFLKSKDPVPHPLWPQQAHPAAASPAE